MNASTIKKQHTVSAPSRVKALHPVSTWIRARKTTYAYSFLDKDIPKSTIEEIVTNGLWAPTHKMTQPWRFEVLQGDHKNALGEYMLAYYKEKLTAAQFPESRHAETATYAKNATLIAIVFQRSQRIQIPEWEEIAAISCAVQNMWLSTSAMNLAGYWDTAGATIAYCEEHLALRPHEKSLGIFYVGYPVETQELPKRKRKSIDKKLIWNFKK
ncbi:nitroreductase [Aquimarina sp. U1-2]|uniref:nitroreductase family protein n=1 Tax=Aquimarina sp. U1-2 TaxID=2823141 RepID=UPI001AECF78E|nr:nitroreductase [Aquimarina sp. U1-2]MBP2831638.1 nitroreductase [Aquimarina sp. U1-2]